MKFDLKARFKNIYFWGGIVGLLLTATGVNPETLTSWDALYAVLKQFVSNPVMIGSFIMALLGILVNTGTKGFMDNK
jgi:phi LC3 family holin